MNFKEFYNESTEIPEGWKTKKANGLSVCGSCVRDTPCPDCPNIIFTMARELKDLGVVYNEEYDQASHPSGFAVYTKEEQLRIVTPGGGENIGKVRNWKQIMEDWRTVLERQ